MPFDPSKPANHSANSSAEMRGQLNGLKELIDAIPAGPPGAPGEPGPQGEPGTPFAASVVDAVVTVPFGDPAAVLSSFDGSAVHFTFHIPAGQPGPQGAQGDAGEVTLTALNDAVNTRAAKPSGVAPFGGSFSNPPTQAEVQALADWAEELRAALMG